MEMFEWEWLIRLLAAITAGFLIGFERHSHAKDAGIRTHMMVALGS
ncbi:MAG: MgtC/SapB family protein, partial [Solobacterium sp.]|nr:MgtC/SapB family protein [Solobacterium sp.]